MNDIDRQQKQIGPVQFDSEMSLFTFVIRFEGNHIVYQESGSSPAGAMLKSLRCANPSLFGELLTNDQAEDMIDYLLSEEFGPAFSNQVEGCVNVWNESWALGKDNVSVFITCVRTDPGNLTICKAQRGQSERFG